MIPRIRKEYLKQAPALAWNILFSRRYAFTFDLMPLVSETMTYRRRMNLLASGMNLLYRRARPWCWPTHMMAELTNTCNLKCPVCPTGSGLLKREKGFLDLDLFERMMEEVGPRLLMIFLWGWGEPFLHPSFDRAVRISRRHGVMPVLSTNGQLLARDDVREKLLADPPEYLIVAIDGLTDETNAPYRVGARMELTLEGVHKLVEERRRGKRPGPHLNMRYIVMQHNEHEIDRVETFAREHGFDSFSIRTLSSIEDGSNAHTGFVPTAPGWRAYDYDGESRVKREDFLCHMAFTFPTLFVDGTIVTCDQDANASHPIGRYGDGRSFKDIWFGREAANVRRVIRDDRNSYSFCRACPYADRELHTCNVVMRDLTK